MTFALGGRVQQFRAFGMEEKSRVGRLEEVVTLVRALLAGERVTHRGRYYTLEDLKRRPLETLQALLLESGVRVRCRVGQCLALGSDGGRVCAMLLFLDGARVPADYLNLARVDELAGVEVYKVPVEVPPEFWSGLRSPCGAVAMWSRR